jgi:23S rRNA (cytidine2498-2'-O)-methyltransferase
MQLLLWADDSEAELRAEMAWTFPDCTVREAAPGLLESDFPLANGRPLPYLAFARQWLPEARPVQAASIRAWVDTLFNILLPALPEQQPWRLHIEPHYGVSSVARMGARAWHSATRPRAARPSPSPAGTSHAGSRATRTHADAGQQRARLIREALLELLKRKRRHLLRQLQPNPDPFTASDSLVQLLLTSPERGFVSVASAPMPFEERHLLSPFPRGQLPPATDKAAPSRAFGKLVEAELRLGRKIAAGEVCVDLGASPGSWTYVAANRGASVVAVDRSPLREDLMHHPSVNFLPGDAFQFKPTRPADWLLCDVIAPPEQTLELLDRWLQNRWCRYFVVTFKLRDEDVARTLPELKRALPALTRELFLTRLNTNKKELSAFGESLLR